MVEDNKEKPLGLVFDFIDAETEINANITVAGSESEQVTFKRGGPYYAKLNNVKK